jgi:phosphatidate phosphatase APP1
VVSVRQSDAEGVAALIIAILAFHSGIDDTVIRTDTTIMVRMFRATFLENARTRLPFPGVAALNRALQRGADGTTLNPLFYVSSSPWNMYDNLEEFLAIQHIPAGPLLLRAWC